MPFKEIAGSGSILKWLFTLSKTKLKNLINFFFFRIDQIEENVTNQNSHQGLNLDYSQLFKRQFSLFCTSKEKTQNKLNYVLVSRRIFGMSKNNLAQHQK